MRALASFITAGSLISAPEKHFQIPVLFVAVYQYDKARPNLASSSSLKLLGVSLKDLRASDKLMHHIRIAQPM